MKQIKMIGLDLDGTLLRDDKTISSRSRKAIKKAIAQGVIVLAATGRPYTGVPKELQEFPGMRYLLSSNGARIQDLLSGKILYESLLKKESALEVLDVFDKYDTIQEIYFHGVGYMDAKNMQRVGEFMHNPYMAEYIRKTRKPVDSIRDKAAKMNCSLDKVQGLFYSLEERGKALEALKHLNHIEVTGALANNIEVNNKGVNKGASLIRLGKLLGISQAEIMACGDGRNDEEMMVAVGFSVAMGNADPAVKEKADYVTETNENDGVARAIEKYVLQ